jgi:nucleotide-binding universal stress UspA family protein
MRIQRVLCPTDLSGGSLAALHRAAALARRHDAELHVLHAAPDVVELPLSADSPDGDGSARTLRAWLAGADLAGADLAGVTPRLASGLGDPTTTIVDYARDETIDLIVMGTHGRTGVDRLRRGSIAARVRACAAAPVLTVPLRGDPADGQAPATACRPFTRVLCAVNLSDGARAAVALAQWFAQEHDAELMLLHIVDRLSPDEIVDIGYGRLADEVRERQEMAAVRLRALVPHYARMSGQAHERVEMGAPAETILDVAREWNADLLVLGAEERSRLSSLLLGSTTRTIVARAPAPVLTATPVTEMSWRSARDYLAIGRGVH